MASDIWEELEETMRSLGAVHTSVGCTDPGQTYVCVQVPGGPITPEFVDAAMEAVSTMRAKRLEEKDALA